MINAEAMWNHRGVAVDPDACLTRRWRRRGCNCHCGACAVCGNAKHTAIHGGFFGEDPGGRPYGHEFVSLPTPEEP